MRQSTRRPPSARLLAPAAAVLLAAAVATATPAAASDEDLDAIYATHLDPQLGETCVEVACGTRCQQTLDRARAATAAYLQEATALEHGYHADPICVAVPGVGGMGIHYAHPGRLADGKIDSRFPEILVYEEQPSGKRRLVALEYFMPVLSNGRPWMGAADQPPPTVDNPAPVLFGRRFDGPMPGHAPGMPWHYDLHVWVWKHNPAGTFAQFNPTVECR